MATKPKATIEDLYQVSDDGKAELVHGDLVAMSPTGDLPNRAAGAIYLSLRLYERSAENGRAYTDNAGFRVELPRRESFSPDAAFYIGPRAGGKFLEGGPVFAAEVRSEGDYGARAKRAMAEKRADYFAAGTLVVWDVDVLKDSWRSFGSIGRQIPLALQRIGAASPLTRSRRSLGGECRWTSYSNRVYRKRLSFFRAAR